MRKAGRSWPIFLSTLSLRRATAYHFMPNIGTLHFYPRSPCGERLTFLLPLVSISLFLSTLSLRRATVLVCSAGFALLFLSTLSLRRATVHYDNYNLHCVISIHALLAESDAYIMTTIICTVSFLSTLSLRRATIFALLMVLNLPLFLSTLSLRRATDKRCKLGRHNRISIHALLAESDTLPRRFIGGSNNFYPRSPCGERPPDAIASTSATKFLSTLSLRRATAASRGLRFPPLDFYPRSPCGERRGTNITLFIIVLFLSTLSLRRATWGG